MQKVAFPFNTLHILIRILIDSRVGKYFKIDMKLSTHSSHFIIGYITENL